MQLLNHWQATGEATFPSDEVISPQSLCGALVFSSQCAVLLAAIDPSQALAIDGTATIMCEPSVVQRVIICNAM